ncbi:hypothetical protein [Microbispora bryophytorum]
MTAPGVTRDLGQVEQQGPKFGARLALLLLILEPAVGLPDDLATNEAAAE